MKHTRTILMTLAVLLVLPFWTILLVHYLLPVLYALGIQAPRLAYALLGAPHFFATGILNVSGERVGKVGEQTPGESERRRPVAPSVGRTVS